MLAEMDDAEVEGLDEFDEVQLKKLCVALERKTTRNQQQRIKYASDPTKFVDSEVELHEEIQAFHVAATAPKYYPVLVQLGTAGTLMSLLMHENADICLAIVALLQELTDGDSVEDDEDAARVLLSAMLENDFLRWRVGAHVGGGGGEEEEEEEEEEEWGRKK